VSIQAFKDVIARFNYAGPVGGVNSPRNYDAVLNFLTPNTNNIEIQRVTHDQPDPGNPLKGTPAQVVDKLNSDQIGQWPTLEYDPNSLTLDPPNPSGAHLVRGTGRYTDKQSDVPLKQVTVNFAYHFDVNDKIDMVTVGPLGIAPPVNLTLGQNPY
jgi:hypothetical protein